MPLQLTPWVVPSLVALGVSLAVAAFAFRRSRLPGATAMGLTAACGAWWALFQVVGVSLTSVDGKLWAAKVQYLGVAPVGVAWLWFAVRFTDQERRFGRRALIALLIVPAVTIVLAFTNEWHRLVWAAWRLLPGPAYVSLQLDYGPWFRVFQLYSYALTAAGTFMLVWHLAQARHHHLRIVGVVAAPAVVIGLNLLYQSPLHPPQWVDLTPAGFALGAAILASTLLRGRLFDLPPVARARVLDQLKEGVLVVDHRGRILDLNPAAERQLGLGPGAALPSAMQQIIAHGQSARGGRREPVLVRHDPGDGMRDLEVRGTPWEKRGGSDRFVLVLRDTTDRDRMDQELRAANEALSRMNAELTRLARTDTLTGLANRGHLMETLAVELKRAVRHRRPLALLVLDLDHFKEVNDQFGHPTGDAVLQATAKQILAALRESDLAARMGGEEFAVLLPETEVEGACILAERIRLRLSEQRFTAPDGASFGVTASVGVAARQGEMTVRELVQAADAAMYVSKDAGRNRVTRAPASVAPDGG